MYYDDCDVQKSLSFDFILEGISKNWRGQSQKIQFSIAATISYMGAFAYPRKFGFKSGNSYHH